MHLDPFVPSALASSNAQMTGEFLADLLKQLERHRNFLLKEIRKEVGQEIRSLEGIDTRLGWAQEKWVGHQIWNDAGELQSHASIGIDGKIIQLSVLERTIRHIRNFLFPEEKRMIELEYEERRRANERRNNRFPDPVVPESKPKSKKRKKSARKEF